MTHSLLTLFFPSSESPALLAIPFYSLKEPGGKVLFECVDVKYVNNKEILPTSATALINTIWTIMTDGEVLHSYKLLCKEPNFENFKQF